MPVAANGVVRRGASAAAAAAVAAAAAASHHSRSRGGGGPAAAATPPRRVGPKGGGAAASAAAAGSRGGDGSSPWIGRQARHRGDDGRDGSGGGGPAERPVYRPEGGGERPRSRVVGWTWARGDERGVRRWGVRGGGSGPACSGHCR